MKRFLISITTGLALFFFATGVVAAQGQYVSGSTGVDVSWPNCTASISKVAFGVVGTTGGTAYSNNSCLGSEASNFNNLSLYVNTGWNNVSTHIDATSPKLCTTGDNNCLAYNYGYNAGVSAVQYTISQGVKVNTTWWLDVETGNTWNSDTTQNRNSLQGEYDALIANGATQVGAYSTTAQWNSITGSWVNNWVSWGATTWRTAKQAQTYCTGHEFTGGKSLLMQYLGKLDQDVAC